MKTAYDYDLTSPEVMENPYEFYAAIHRDNARAVPVKGVGYWVGRMADIRDITSRTDTFSNNFFPEGAPIPTGVGTNPLEKDVKDIYDKGPKVVNALWATDPPKHSVHRLLVNKAFAVTWVRSMEPRIRSVANGLIDQFITRGKVNFVQEYARYVPLVLIAEALGISRNELERFKRWSDDILTGNLDVLDHEARLRVARSFVEAMTVFRGLAQERRRSPESDLISSLATAEVEGGRLDMSEILPIISQLLLAGNETTQNLTGNAIGLLLKYPKVMASLRADYSLIPNFIHEVMRFDTSIQGLYRVVVRDTSIGDVRIRQGSKVILGFGTAGRDPEVFENPDDFDIYRKNAHKNIGFGFGPHVCVGAELAKAEVRIALETLFDRVHSVQLQDSGDLSHKPSFSSRGYKRLDCVFESAKQ